MKKLTLTVIGLIMVLLLIIACTPTTPQTSSTDSTSSSTTLIKDTTSISPEKDTSSAKSGITGAAVGSSEETIVPITLTLPSKPIYDPKIQDLLDKNKDLTSYEYFFRTVSRSYDQTLLEDTAFTVYIKDGKIHKIYPQAKYWKDGLYYNEVYLNSNTKTAFITCTKDGVTCDKNWQKAYSINYDTEKITMTPLSLLENIPMSAKVVGEALLEDRKVTLVEYPTSDGNKERLYIDSFYGLALEQKKYTLNKDEEEVILEDRLFSSLGAGKGTVKNSDVDIPEDYTVVN